ncbi:MAG: hypothetical protein MK198_06730 [Gracilimonas sp.]|uniref:hypothetical protein n=1 Tax=Gracilimonas sp. TaxID=1974203 RepID=UPI003750ED9E|nr:hypothetical protein [Gracilimonas sp.]
MGQNFGDFKRQFSGTVEDLQSLFFQILLHEYNRYEFLQNDWRDFTLSYGQIFFRFESLWIDKAKEFEGLSKSEIREFIEQNPVTDYKEAYVSEYKGISKKLDRIHYDLDLAYPDFLDLNSFSFEHDINIPITEIFTTLKGSFPVIDHDPGVWAFNAQDIESKIPELTSAFDDLVNKFIDLELAQHLLAYIKYGDDEQFSLRQKVARETEAFNKEWAFSPDLLSWSNERSIFLLGLKYCKIDGSSLDPETLRRTINRMKKNHNT